MAKPAKKPRPADTLRVKPYVERVKALMLEQKALSGDVSDVCKEAKEVAGLDPTTLRFVAREALIRHKWLFFPAWAELQDVCDKLAAPRRAMIWHLQNAPQAQEPDEREIPSAEKRAEMVAYAQRITKEMAERANNGN